MGLGKLLPAFVTRLLYDRRAHQAFPTAHLDSRRVSLTAELGHMVRIGENVTVQHGVSIGDFSYASTGTAIFSGTIGRFCSIGQYVRIGAFQHPLDHFSTSPWIYGANNLFGLPHSPDEFPKPPVIDCVVMANTVHGYISQSDKGELVIGGGTDPYNNYSQRGSFPALEHTVTALVETFPIISRLRMLRMWGGIVDMTGDRSPIISKTPVEGLYVNCGWGTGGFKAIPGSGYVFADTIANNRPHPIAEPFGLNRFVEGRLIDERVAAAVAH